MYIDQSRNTYKRHIQLSRTISGRMTSRIAYKFIACLIFLVLFLNSLVEECARGRGFACAVEGETKSNAVAEFLFTK
jgi:hypothetical protein